MKFRDVFNILVFLILETISFSSWIFWLCCDMFFKHIAVFFFSTWWYTRRVQLPTGIAVGVRRRGHFFFDSLVYGTSKRFQAPQPLTPQHNRVLNAEHPDVFAQPVGIASMDTPALIVGWKMRLAKLRAGYLGCESAHQLSIWLPSSSPPPPPSASCNNGYPVLVWFHGGAHVFGSKNQQLHNGAELARRGVIVVSAAYRLGVFGYLSTDGDDDDDGEREGDDPTNYGVDSCCGTKDQLLVLKFVKENIARFGGDANNITLAGQSAGSISASSLLAIDGVVSGPHNNNTGLVNKAFLCSGGSQHTQTRKQAAAVFALFGKHVGMDISSKDISGALRKQRKLQLAKHLSLLPTACLLKLQTVIINDISGLYRNCSHNGLMPFSPFISLAKDSLFKKNPMLLFREEQKALSLPILCGTTRHEYTFFTSLSMPPTKSGEKWHPINDKNMLRRINQWTSEINNTTNSSSSSSSGSNIMKSGGQHQSAALDFVEEAKKVEAAYVNGSFQKSFKHSHPVWNAVNGDFVFRVPTERIASANRGNSFVYVFAEESSLLDRLQSTHVIDLHCWFGTVLTLPALTGFHRGIFELQERCVSTLVEFVSRKDLNNEWKTTQQDASDDGTVVIGVDGGENRNNNNNNNNSLLWQPWTDHQRPAFYLQSQRQGGCQLRCNEDEQELRSWERIFDALDRLV